MDARGALATPRAALVRPSPPATAIAPGRPPPPDAPHGGRAGKTNTTAAAAAAGSTAPGIVLRPVVFVVDATRPAPSRGGDNDGGAEDDDDEEPFDVLRAGDDDEVYEQDAYESFLAALRGQPRGSGGGEGGSGACYASDVESVAASCASSSAAPTFSSPGSFGGGADGSHPADEAESPSPARGRRRFESPFTRLRKGWRTPSKKVPADADDEQHDDHAGGARHRALTEDMEDDPDDNTETTAASSSVGRSDNVSGALLAGLSSYSKDNPPVHFASRRARIVSVSRRHAFPPSKFPDGKMPADPSSGSIAGGGGAAAGSAAGGIMLGETHGGTAWMSSYEIQNEGILPSGWLEKHARALPSAVLAVTALKMTGDESARTAGARNAARAVEDLRATLAEKRNVPIHLACLVREEEGEEAWSQRDLNAMRDRICQECSLPQNRVFLLKFPTDLEPDDFEAGILRSPYLGGGAAAASAAGARQSSVMTAPLLRRLDRSLRDSSALYYSRLADAQERKLALWRNRYHSTNVSFEVNTLMAAMRCARYATKAGTLREFQMRTGGGGAGRWTDAGSSAMRNYDEAYRWTMELHRRAVAWRVASLSSGSAPSSSGSGYGGGAVALSPMTPGAKNFYSREGDHLRGPSSPMLTESPGGGIGVELSYPGAGPPPNPPPYAGATPPPPPTRRNSPALTSRRGYGAPENVAFFASLWEQTRAVAGLLNAKLLRCASASAGGGGDRGWNAEAEEQRGRHRLAFLVAPRGVPGFRPAEDDDDFFGPAWRRFSYVADEMLTYACIAEGRWRRAAAAASAASDAKNEAATRALCSSHDRPGAPWSAYGELGEAVLGLRGAIERHRRRSEGKEGGVSSNNASSWQGAFSGSGRRFVGSITSGESGFGTMKWRFETEARRDHQAIALDHILHALDLLEENATLGGGPDSATTGGISSTHHPSSSARLHYIAGRLSMGMDDPAAAWVHLKIASSLTKSWPSLHVSVQRALFACEERRASSSPRRGGSVAAPSAAESRDSRIELLLRPGSCRLLSRAEMAEAESMTWGGGDVVPGAPAREVVWNHDDVSCGAGEPPFEFAVSFLKSTHATSGDAVAVCVSIRSRLDIEICVGSMKLLTTSGIFDVQNLEQCAADREMLLSRLRGEEQWRGDQTAMSFESNRRASNGRGIRFGPGDEAFFLTEIALPSDLASVATYGGGGAGPGVDASKFVPKNGRLCNMGLSHAAGNICESRPEVVGGDNEEKISLNGKPIALSSISKASSSFLGGIPMVCHGIVLALRPASRSTLGNSSSMSSLELKIDRPRLISPLLRSGPQRLAMEESNYMAHSWSRPDRHLWCLGPRVLRVLGPHPGMQVTNLTEALTGGKAVEGTVNRIVLRLVAGEDEDCWDVRARLRCASSTALSAAGESSGPVDDTTAAPEGGGQIVVGAIEGTVDPHRMPTFVMRSADPTAVHVGEGGAALPRGWEPRNGVSTDQAHEMTTDICLHLEAGKSILFPLDIFRPLDHRTSPSSLEDSAAAAAAEASTCTMSYEVIITYKQVRAGKGGRGDSILSSDEQQPLGGYQVMVMQSGSVKWVSPLAAEFVRTDGPTGRAYPRGIQHASNAVTSPPSAEPGVAAGGGTELVAAEGERVQMRCSLQSKRIGPSGVAASIMRVTNEIESITGPQRILHSSESCVFMNQTKHGSKLSLSYSVPAVRDVEGSGKNETIPLGVISVNWKPASLPPVDQTSADVTTKEDGLGLTHGPLSLPDLAPVTFYGPPCHVLDAPFEAKLLKCPSMPKVGAPFRILYRVTNRTAKSQAVILALNNDVMQDGDNRQDTAQLLCTGKLKEEVEMAPFEEKTFSFTFMSMYAGKVPRPPLTVSSVRHQTWVINETVLSSRYLFVMP